MYNYIDADSHIEEHHEIFNYLDKEYMHRRPADISIGDMVKHRPTRNRVWLIDGEMRPKLFGHNASCYATPPTSDFAKLKPVTPEVQGISDVDAYIECLNSKEIDVVVLYPTLFLHPVTRDPLFEAALMRAYNSWLAETCAKQPKRLKWAALIPMRSIPDAISEVKRAKALGASSVMLLATVGNTLLHDRRFDPVYQAIQDANLPICIHTGYAHDGINDSCESPASALVLNFEMSMVMALFSFLSGGILDRFPNLKVGFLEAGTLWLYAALDRMMKWRETPTAEVWPAQKSPLEYLKNNQVYFTIEGDEPNLREFVDLVGVDRVLGSGDFPHVHYKDGKIAETFTDIKMHKDLSDADKKLILSKNAEKFYNFSI
jgi:predicted TIM-barrel fold metal-dependent hydrolase